MPMPVERPAAPAAAPDTSPTPEFLRPPPAGCRRAANGGVSAPVSRSIPSSDRDRIETNPNTVKLSPAELEIARSCWNQPHRICEGQTPPGEGKARWISAGVKAWTMRRLTILRIAILSVLVAEEAAYCRWPIIPRNYECRSAQLVATWPRPSRTTKSEFVFAILAEHVATLPSRTTPHGGHV